ncbi:6-phosphogluconolactonase [Salinactinospora qingdaonensis]|uniref:6-phosphogluconolactonase n=1 Tax=Salinactinospora qingdaonensis TaxID=702744 RepID=A0ABP7EZF7_9ACTN
MSAPAVVVHRDADLLAKATAARVITTLVDAQAARGHAAIALTGGTIGIAVLDQVRREPARDAVDWRRLDVWWGDERFLPSGDRERNETQAREALLDHLELDPARVHPMPAADSAADTPEQGAHRYAEELRAAAERAGAPTTPALDLVLLGVGPDAHVASLFPQAPALAETERTVVAVHGSPKPPPTRVTLTVPAIKAAREVWLLASGTAKAEAVGLALRDSGSAGAPAARARGRSRTLFLLDEAAAGQVPSELPPARD